LGLSLRELARRTDVTASFLSQVELDQTNTSLNSLRRIAEALDVSILYFLEDGPHQDPVVRADSRSRLSFANLEVVYELLTSDLSRKMEMFLGKLGPNTGNVARRLREPTEECIYVLTGSLLIGLDSGEYILNPGDSIYFDGVLLHKLANACDDEETTWISVVTPPVF
jgi:transcriptional regulator with XRE-family HTH domain|tara:strand:+ start:593 stop:1096 length:504 start_codon:yes stop_codon:yes gene_type:complete